MLKPIIDFLLGALGAFIVSKEVVNAVFSSSQTQTPLFFKIIDFLAFLIIMLVVIYTAYSIVSNLGSLDFISNLAFSILIINGLSILYFILTRFLSENGIDLYGGIGRVILEFLLRLICAIGIFGLFRKTNKKYYYS